jgi:hypothetical protein
MSGTSMATPALSGAAALLRQYLTEGNMATYGSGHSEFNADQPSAALLKALLIASTVSLQYGYDSSGSSVDLAAFYSGSSPTADSEEYALGTTGIDFHQGFGEVQLSNILPMTGSEFETIVFESRLLANDEFSVILAYSGVGIITATATLVWTDPPASTGSHFEDRHEHRRYRLAQFRRWQWILRGAGRHAEQRGEGFSDWRRPRQHDGHG